MEKAKVLFICMGNICRSPTAHGVFLKLVEDHRLSDRVEVDSAGTHAYHVGQPPDTRSQAAAWRRGVDLSPLRARQVTVHDIEYFDYVLAMDRANMAVLQNLAPSDYFDKLAMFLDYAPHLSKREVPDPYYGGDTGFEQVLDLVEAASEGLLNAVKQRFVL